MTFNVYKRLYDKSTEEKSKTITKQILFGIISSSILLGILLTFLEIFNFGISTVMYGYFTIYIILELLLLFSANQLYESTTFIIKFLKHTPITINKLYFSHFLSSKYSFSNLFEIITLTSILLIYNVDILYTLIFIISLQVISLIRTYLEFLLLYSQTKQVKIFTLTHFVFIITMIFYIIVKTKSINIIFFENTNMLIISVLLITFLISLLTYKHIIEYLMKNNEIVYNAIFIKLTFNTANLISKLIKFNASIASLIKIHIIRLLRNQDYISRLLKIGILLFIFSSISFLFFDQSAKNNEMSDILYFSFFIALFSFSSIRLDYNLVSKLSLDHYPITKLQSRLSIDIAHGILLFMLSLFLLSTQYLLNPTNILNLIDGLLSFICFYFLSLGIEKANIIITPKTKWKMYPLFFIMALIIEAIFLLKFKIWIKLLTLSLCILWSYLRVYWKLKNQ
ncbi:hypothetical protein CN543_04730 [Bacillus toyonensis]|uniref:hypothetical protein n=1 Tax=Bacillus toyonensis TaxID=155322 RepID=UPI000BF0A0AA|nr:hypothetical protein [Bacillus toyonensis]PEN39596.1 hypothetical protein CN543_04730 [Bacillus toyonensis]PEO06533.1 hypothetical protein CN561_04615 [Bacillus toyonensis]